MSKNAASEIPSRRQLKAFWISSSEVHIKKKLTFNFFAFLVCPFCSYYLTSKLRFYFFELDHHLSAINFLLCLVENNNVLHVKGVEQRRIFDKERLKILYHCFHY